jgi:DNA-binding NtrC family response regulator
MLTQILLVEPNGALMALLLGLLHGSGYSVTLSGGFKDAAARVKADDFHALVTAHRLGAHNGLHLIVRARGQRPLMRCVVTSPVPDPVLEAEASRLGALSVVAPWNDGAELLKILAPGGLLTA